MPRRPSPPLDPDRRARKERDAELAAKEAAFEKAKKEEAAERERQVQAAQREVAAIFKQNKEKELQVIMPLATEPLSPSLTTIQPPHMPLL